MDYIEHKDRKERYNYFVFFVARQFHHRSKLMGEGLSLADRFSYSKINELTLKCGSYDGFATSLRSCNLAYREQINLLPEEILLLSDLETLKIEFCTKLDLAAAFIMLSFLPKLRKLQFTNCEIKVVPAEIKELAYLYILDFGNRYSYGVSSNELITFPPEFGSLIRLQSLHLTNIRNFNSFPTEVSKLERLNEINLRGVKALPENTHLIPNLRHLKLIESSIYAKDLVPLVSKPNGLKSVTVEDYRYNSFIALKEYNSDFEVAIETSAYGRGEY
jgi:hypothetical protein